ncbi:GntP family permease [Nocardia jinanensis]|uniref:Gluconate permease n=1 Tax=Nocardia jinanensis TaxID=382504 RepID=A0A917RSA8_9NOCA|nr:SLC13 family permease [Nocardia jinanensis]GGL20210.1 gluconate permease [Nocardia jinanensis]
MSDQATMINTGAAVLAVVVLIIRFKINPAVSLVIGSAYLGLSAGLGTEKTVETIATGFGDIMAEVGLLIAFGVLTGAMLQETGAIERLVQTLVRVFGVNRMPYALSLTVATALQSIYLDVLLVISAPLARSTAAKMNRKGTARMATALAIGGECGIVLTVPGVGALALAGLLGVPLGKMLLFGLVLVIPTVTIAVAVMCFLFDRGWWNEERDEQPYPGEEQSDSVGVQPVPGTGESESGSAPGTGGVAVVAPAQTAVRTPLPLLLAPLLTALLLIAAGAVLEVAEIHHPMIAFLSTPVIALLIGLVGTSVVGRRSIGIDRIQRSIATGFQESGQILILTGVGGSLAATVAATGLGDILGDYFTASTAAPLLMVWAIAAVLHIAVGSVTISAITAAGILAPVAPALGIDPVLIALAAGAGSLFAVHVTSNTFWLLQSLMGQTTRGTLKTCSVGVSIASVVAILLIMPLSLVL